MATAQSLLYRKLQQNTTAIVKSSSIQQSTTVDQQQAQSLQLIQDHLATWIGSLSYLRGFFPAECFVKKAYGTSTGIPTSSGSRHEVMELVKGVTPEADVLLDILHNGVLKALSSGYLRALQIGIYLDEEHPDIVVESYTFSFSYRTDGDLALHVTNLSGNLVSLNTVKSAQQLTRILVMITQGLHPLPGRFSLQIIWG